MVTCPICGRAVHSYDMTLAWDNPEEVCKDCAYPNRKRYHNER